MPGGYVGPPFGDDPVAGPGQQATPSRSVPEYPPSPAPQPPPPLIPPDGGDLAPVIDGEPVVIGYGITSEYKKVGSKEWSPYAGGPDDGPDVAFWACRRPFTVKRVTFVCRAIGGTPPVPDPDTGSDNEVLISEDYSIATPAPGPTGEEVCTVAGVYFYVLQRGLRPGDSFGTSRHPMSIYPAAMNTLDPADFEHMLGAARVLSYNGNVINF